MKKTSVVVKIFLSLILIADLILNIFLFKMACDIKKDLYNISWDVSTIDNNIYDIEKTLSTVQDDIDDIKSDVSDIEWNLDHYF